jgi:hypothetical protein
MRKAMAQGRRHNKAWMRKMKTCRHYYCFISLKPELLITALNEPAYLHLSFLLHNREPLSLSF